MNIDIINYMSKGVTKQNTSNWSSVDKKKNCSVQMLMTVNFAFHALQALNDVFVQLWHFSSIW